ncbi:MAG TPA: protein-glutamate O-methyltransferase CheR [Anaeromyxobacteraceae bacterium]|nr:protein-glutamate O-methyltransferase CheR [Anaeromyxobacteraceae bacterium]
MPETADLGAADLAGVEEVLVRTCGLSLTAGLGEALRSAVQDAAGSLGLEAPQLLLRLRAADPAAIEALVEHSVVGETYFYRHPEQFAALQRHLFAQPGPIRAWCAGCATGEEPYSLAMALLEAGRDGAGDRILATDVSGRALERARRGRYGHWSLRRLPAELLARHFQGDGAEDRALPPRIRDMVAFGRQNLVTDPPPAGPFDLVLCRNVLIYFAPKAAAEVLRRLVAAVRRGGFLALGPVELSLADALAVERVEAFGATLLRRPADG